MGEREHLEQPSHLAIPRSGEAARRGCYGGRGVGRGIALDRDKNWAKVKKAYDSLTLGKGARYR